MEREKATHPVATLCCVLGVSTSGYWAWRSRPRSRRAAVDKTLTELIRTAHTGSRGTYGAPRVHAELRADGIHCGRKRVARLMRRAGIAGVHRRRVVVTTKRDRSVAPPPTW